MINKKILLLALVALISCLSAARYRDIIYMRDGVEVTGELERITETDIYFNAIDGERIIPKDSVRSIDLGQWRPGADWIRRADIDDKVLLEALEETALSRGLRTEYPTAGHITLYEKGTMTIEEDYTGTYVLRKIVFILNERGRSEGNWQDHYFDDIQSVNVDFARSVARDRTVRSIADNAIEDGSPFTYLSDYQRYRQKKFAMPGADLGAVIDYQVTIEFHQLDDFFNDLRGWNFYDTDPVLKSIYEVRYHRDIPLVYSENNMPVRRNRSRDGQYRVYTWKMENIDAYVEETMLPPVNYFKPNVRISIETPMERLSSRLHEKIMEAYDDEARVKSIIERRIQGTPTVENIYNFVSENYSTNAITMRNYFPYPKPLSSLLSMSQIGQDERVFVLWAFLKAAGMEPELVLLGPNIDTPTPQNLFNIHSFSSYQVRVDDKGTTRYLRPNEFLRYDHQSAPDGRFVLPIRANRGRLEEHDFLPRDYKYSIPKYTGRLLPDGTLEVTYTVDHKGPTGSDDYRRYKYMRPEDIDNRFEETVKQIDELATLTDYTLEGFRNLESEVEISYSCEIPAFAIRAGEEILAFRLPTVEFSAWAVGAQERTLPFTRPGNFHREKLIEIELPEGYTIESMPEPINLDIGYEAFRTNISLDGNVLRYSQTESGYHRRVIDPKRYQEYKNFVEEKSKYGERWVLIRRN